MHMNATEYSRDLADTIYSEVKFTIDPEQFDAELKSVDARAWGWHMDDRDAHAYAQQMADESKKTVEIGVYGFWGHDGKDYIETIMVAPRA